MSYGLRAGISFCAAGGRHFFLDRHANRYFALKDKDEALFLQLLESRIDPAHVRDISPALAPLLCARSNAPLTPFALPHAPRCEMDWQGGRARPILVLRAMLTFILVKASLVRHAPARLFDACARAKPRSFAPHQPDAMLVELGRAFERVRAWTGEDQCLPLSLSFAKLAYGMGYPVTIVLAISPRPFGAHCWVQLGSKVVNDHLGRVETFTPIYAI